MVPEWQLSENTAMRTLGIPQGVGKVALAEGDLRR